MDLAEQAVSKAMWRLVPLLCLLYFISYVDRTNIAFAALTMNKALGLTATQYGLAAGLFYLGYIAVEVPSNLIQTRVGARLWIPRIMISWGLVCIGTAWVTGANSFYAARILLGAAEGGFFPGMIYYITLWFPRQYRSRVIGRFMVATSFSGLLGGPIASLIFAKFEGALGLQSWQWLFIVEGLPAVALGFACWWLLVDRPAHASWLTLAERDALEAVLAREAVEAQAVRPLSLLQGMTNWRVLMLSFLMFCGQATSIGLTFWMPQIIKQSGVSNVSVGLLTMLPYSLGAISLLLYSRFADSRRDRAVPLAAAMAVSALGMVAIGLSTGNTVMIVSALVFTVLAQSNINPLLWSLPTTFLTGVTAAGAFGVISSIGASSGFFAPTLIGWARDKFGGFSASMYSIAFVLVVSASLLMLFCRNLSADAAKRSREAGRQPAA
jgi:MFS transporter, ACS family, tartrate transporter